MRLQTDPKVVAKLVEEFKKENCRFRTYLKGIDIDVEELYSIVHRHYENVASLIDCRARGNCCSETPQTPEDADVKRLAIGLRTKPVEIVTRYVTRKEDNGLTFNRRPGPFLSANRCRVCEHRPDTCRSCPHLQKEEFVFRLAQAVSNFSICPIVLKVLCGKIAALSPPL